MKIWILDDAHFPSGIAAGKLDNYSEDMQKLYLNYNLMDVSGPAKQVTFDIATMGQYYDNPFNQTSHPFFSHGQKKEWQTPDKLIAVVAGRLDGKVDDVCHLGELVDLTEQVKDGQLVWDVPNGAYRVMVIFETHKGGGREGSINFLSKESCKIQIKECYEPHYVRYKEEFGKTILGFFSDEPEVGNISSYDAFAGKIGNPKMPIPWSEELPALMEQRFGADYRTNLAALWFGVGSEAFTADMRVGFMDIATTLCQKNFGEQLGEWCRERGVQYIGHIVEDNNASTGFAASQGHFFRALWGQDWSGVDNIGGQITENGANVNHKSILGIVGNGEFYHHELAKLGASLADIDPKKKGNTMCETFGAYGWEEGTRLMKYEADHLLVRGINRYVPHAFSPKEFPDFDCPPHFYAHGKNPLYKPFGSLMNYLNRVSHLISGGMHEVNVAVLYHAESEWAGKAFIQQGRVGRYLDEAQIDFDYIPADVFRFPEQFDSFYDEEGLHINGHVFTSLILPGLEYITDETREFLKKAKESDFLVLFAERVPEGLENEFVPTKMEDLVRKLDLAGQTDAVIAPLAETMQLFHYSQEDEDYYLVNNEDAGAVYDGKMILPISTTDIYRYDAFTNELWKVDAKMTGEGDEASVEIPIKVFPYEMQILVVPTTDECASELADRAISEKKLLNGADAKSEIVVSGDWKVSFCINENYPDFGDAIVMPELSNLNLVEGMNTWSGIARYENSVALSGEKERVLLVEDAFESVELWVNGEYAGERICPPYRFDITNVAKDGNNSICLECRTTLERMVRGITGGRSIFGPEMIAAKPNGIVGTITVLEK